MKKVKVDLQCPFCGFCKVLKVPSYRKGIYCPSCKQSMTMSQGITDHINSQSKIDCEAQIEKNDCLGIV